MSIQPRQDDETVSQTRFQVKYRKECPLTNSINHVSRVANRFGINAVTCSIRKEEECHQRDPKLLQDRQLYSSKTHWDQSFVIPSRCQVRDLKLVNFVNSMEWQRDKSISKLRLCSYNRCFRVRCRCNSKERKQDHQHMVIAVVSDPIEHVIESSRDARSVNGLSSTLSEPQQVQAEDSNRQYNNSLVHQSSRWSNPGSITVSQEESQLDWRVHSRILQCQSRPPQPSCRVESQVVEDDQELQLATQEGSVQSHPTSVRSISDVSVYIAPQPSNDQLLHNLNECTPTQLESMEAVSSISTSNTFAFCDEEDQLIEFHKGFYNTNISGELVFDDSNSSSSSSMSSVSSSYGTLQELKPPLAYSTINSHRSMLNQLLFLKNQMILSLQ
ncbi:hypothetical protein ACTFIU_003753 [Dictyostelium citrinum]